MTLKYSLVFVKTIFFTNIVPIIIKLGNFFLCNMYSDKVSFLMRMMVILYARYNVNFEKKLNSDLISLNSERTKLI